MKVLLEIKTPNNGKTPFQIVFCFVMKPRASPELSLTLVPTSPCAELWIPWCSCQQSPSGALWAWDLVLAPDKGLATSGMFPDR